jgi:hypothetical protein
MKLLFIRCLVVIHLLVVVITVCHQHEKLGNIYSGLNDLYSAYTNTNRCFGFFAPEVYSDLTPKIIMHNTGTQQNSLYHFANPNFESRVRLYSLMGHFGENNDTTQMNLFSRSWGLKAFNDYPEVKTVDVVIYRNMIPTMQEYNKGKRLYLDFFFSTHLEVE